MAAWLWMSTVIGVAGDAVDTARTGTKEETKHNQKKKKHKIALHFVSGARMASDTKKPLESLDSRGFSLCARRGT